MASGPVVAMVWEGKDVVKQGRAMLGATNPLASAPGTIRGDFAIDVGRVRAADMTDLADGVRTSARRFASLDPLTDAGHGSDSVESAKNEIVRAASRDLRLTWQALWLCGVERSDRPLTTAAPTASSSTSSRPRPGSTVRLRAANALTRRRVELDVLTGSVAMHRIRVLPSSCPTSACCPAGRPRPTSWRALGRHD